MLTKVLSVVTCVPIRNLPNGDYAGTWGGYEVEVTIGDVDYIMKTKGGIRTISAPCVVRVKDGVVTVETKL